jgi:hypothetical protein
MKIQIEIIASTGIVRSEKATGEIFPSFKVILDPYSRPLG